MTPRKPGRATNSTTIVTERFDIRDVAKRAGVSVATVSRTVNKVPTVNSLLAARVHQAIRDLNYFPNTQARALVSGRSRLVGLLVSDITNPFFPELIKCFERAVVEHGYELLIGSTNYDSELQHCLRRMVERNVDGVAVMTFGVEDPVLDELSHRNIPMVFVDVSETDFPQDVLLVNYGQGMLEALQHLVALGHRDIGFISGPLREHSALLRRHAFLASMHACDCNAREDLILEGDHQLEGGMLGMTALLRLPHPPTAVLCSNDMTAIGALRTLQQRGFRVPDDMSLVGFDDIHLTEFVHPPLTTVRMSQTEIAQSAVRSLLSRIEETAPSAAPQSFPISTRLIVRETTAPPALARQPRS